MVKYSHCTRDNTLHDKAVSTLPGAIYDMKSEQPSMSYLQGLILVMAAGVFWSFMALGIRLIEEGTLWQILFYRSIALCVFLFFLIAVRSGWRPVAAIVQAGWAGIFGGFSLFLAFTGAIYSIQNTNVANAIFLFAAAPFIAAILGMLLLKERVQRATWIAMFFAVIGITVMVIDGFSVGQASGNLAALGSAIGFAMLTIALRWGKVRDMLPAIFLGGLFSTVIAAVFCLATNSGLQMPIQDTSIALSLGVFQLGVGLSLFTIGSRVVPAAELALLSMTEVVLGPVWVWLILGESTSIETLIGGAVLLLAIGGNAVAGIRRERRMRAFA